MIRHYVAQTHPCAETLAKANLEAQGFETFLPVVVEEARRGVLGRKRVTALAPLFPGYMFIALDLSSHWRAACSTKGVRRLLGRDSEHPTPLPIGAIPDLVARYDAGEFVQRVTTFRVNAGDDVTIAKGAFEGCRGVCVVSRGERIQVLLSLLGGAVKMDMTTDFVRPLEIMA